jgi:hypothetical protein
MSIVFVAAAGYDPDRYMVAFVPLFSIVYAAAIRRLYDVIAAAGARGRAWFSPRLVPIGFVAVLLAAAVASTDEMSRQPKSGMRELVRSSQVLVADPRVVWLIAPDYIASSFGYYTRARRVAYYGFARWDHPELYRLADYAALWQQPHLVESTLTRIDDQACSGYRRLAFIELAEHAPRLADEGVLPIHLVSVLADDLRRRYPVTRQAPYFGLEREQLTVFALHCSIRRLP